MLQKSRRQVTIAKRYNLETNRAEKTELSPQHPAIVVRMRDALEKLIARGATRT